MRRMFRTFLPVVLVGCASDGAWMEYSNARSQCRLASYDRMDAPEGPIVAYVDDVPADWEVRRHARDCACVSRLESERPGMTRLARQYQASMDALPYAHMKPTGLQCPGSVKG